MSDQIAWGSLMAYTSTDLTNIESAILSLAAGEREVRVTIGDKTFEYSNASLDQLKCLRAEIQAEVNAASGSRGFFLTSTSKGL